jgi:hypothetical protein
MHPIRISENQSSSTAAAGTGAGLLGGEVPRDLIIRRESRHLGPGAEECDLSTSSGNPLGRCEETLCHSDHNHFNRHPLECGESKGQFRQMHSHSIPVTSKEVMKTINDGAASYLSTKQVPGSSTSKIVDRALDVVKARNSSEPKSHDAKKGYDGDGASQSSHATCNTTNHSVCTNTTAASSTTCSSTNTPVSPEATAESEPNMIAPSLRKIAKKRRKEPDKNGMERSSFHHTKSSKEYLRKAQEALKQQTMNSASGESVNDSDSEPIHSPRSNFRMLSQVSATAVRSSVTATPFSRSPTCSNVAEIIKTDEDASPSNPYGYEDPDAAASSSTSNPYGYEDPDAAAASSSTSNPYGYEDPDANAARILPAARRVGPARRRGSVTKFSLQAAQAAQKATERIMRLQGLNWKGSSETSISVSVGGLGRSTTPTGRRSQPRHAMESTQSILPIPVRRRSIPMDNWDSEPSPQVSENRASGDAMEVSNPYGYEASAPLKQPSVASSSRNQYGYEDPDAAISSASGATASNPYGYADNDTLPRQPTRSHPRARRRGSVTKFSLDAAKTVSSFESENSAPSPESKPVNLLEGSEDFVMALKPPAAGRPAGFTPKNRRRGVVTTGEMGQEGIGGILQLRRNNSSSSDQASPRRNAPTRNGSARSASSRHLARFGAPGRSDSFLSCGSAASWEDDADSLAPDMESLCSIHDRGDLGMDFTPVPPVSGLSPITPGITPGNGRNSLSNTFSGNCDGGLSRKLPESQRSFSERSNRTIVTFPADGEFAILPFAASGGDSRSSARMPAPPIRRAPSNSTSGNSTSLQSSQPSTSVSS